MSIVNPLAIKSFGQSELSRTKTDKADAALIARFCITMQYTESELGNLDRAYRGGGADESIS